MLRLFGQHKAPIATIFGVPLVVVVVDPGREAAAQPVDKGPRNLVEGRAHTIGGKGNIQHHHTPGQAARPRQLARRCEEQRIEFVGPRADSIEIFGDKIAAKKLAEQMGVPTIPGYQGNDQTTTKLLMECERIGYPVIVKAAAGGGGRGLKVAMKRTEADAAIESAKREGLASFGSDKVFLEKYLDQAKHIEVQVFGDASGRIYHLFDRECSIQRRHQKIIEEATSPNLSEEMRMKLFECAIKLADKAKYRSAGTVEFLVQGEQFYFMEMNTRLQVEHPVTELVAGVDLVKSQLLTAAKRPVAFDQVTLSRRGHAIECRLYAEDAYKNGIPSTGLLGHIEFPAGPNRRFEYGIEPGDEITSFYDSMIAKLVVWDETRPRAIQKMMRVIDDTIIFGVKTNLPFLREILRQSDFLDGKMTTGFINKYFSNGLVFQDSPDDKTVLEAADRGLRVAGAQSVPGKTLDPWSHQWGRS